PARNFFRDWQHEWREKHEENVGDKTGTARRMPDLALKIAMNLTLSQGTGLELEIHNVEEAVEQCTKLLSKKKQVLFAQGKQQFAYPMKMILAHLSRAPDYKLTRKQLLTRGYGDYDSFELDRISETLIDSGAISVKNEGPNKVYRLTTAGVEILAGLLKER